MLEDLTSVGLDKAQGNKLLKQKLIRLLRDLYRTESDAQNRGNCISSSIQIS